MKPDLNEAERIQEELEYKTRKEEAEKDYQYWKHNKQPRKASLRA